MDPLLCPQLQLGQFPNGQNDRSDVQNDVDSGIRPALHVDIVACAFRLSVPVFPGGVDWSALEYGHENVSDSVARCDGHYDVDGDSKALLCRKYPEVKAVHG